eukprot:COSAG01_NODE_17481_length_1147_cov_4.397901_2_plen_232_part_01
MAARCQERRAQARRRKATITQKISQNKRLQSNLEYKVAHREGALRKAREAQDAEGEVAHGEQLAALRGQLGGAQAELQEQQRALQAAEAWMGEVDEEGRGVAARQGEVDELRKQAEAALGTEWNARVRQAVLRADSHAGGASAIERVLYREAHADFDGAVTAWRHVGDLTRDSSLVVDALRTCVCARPDGAANALLQRVLDAWLPADVLSGLEKEEEEEEEEGEEEEEEEEE